MSYNQAMKHWKNHRKDKYFQPCSGPVVSHVDYSCSQDEEDRRAFESMNKILSEDHQFPIYLWKDKIGFWEIVPRNHIACSEIMSREDLESFAERYLFS